VVTLSLETAPKGYFGNRVFQELRRSVDGELERPGIGPRQQLTPGLSLGHRKLLILNPAPRVVKSYTSRSDSPLQNESSLPIDGRS